MKIYLANYYQACDQETGDDYSAEHAAGSKAEAIKWARRMMKDGGMAWIDRIETEPALTPKELLCAVLSTTLPSGSWVYKRERVWERNTPSQKENAHAD